MTIEKLALEYGESAARLRERIRELDRAREETEDEELRLRLDRRLRPLRSMYRDTRAVARHLEGYYGGKGRRQE